MIKLEPEKYYHIYNRGNNREKLFYQARNYAYFLERYVHHCFHVFDTYAYCLMGNHFHMLIGVRPLEKQKELFQKADLNSVKLRSPSRHLSNFFNAYALAINKQQDRVGSLFQRPFRRKEVTSDTYFCRLVIYIHQNPIKHGFELNINNYPYSSYHHYFEEESSFLNKEKAMELFGGLENFQSAHKQIVTLKDDKPEP